MAADKGKGRSVRSYYVSRTFIRILIEAIYKLSMELAEPVSASEAVKTALRRYSESRIADTTHDIGAGDAWHAGDQVLVIAWTSQDREVLARALERYEARTSKPGSQIEVIAAALTMCLTA